MKNLKILLKLMFCNFLYYTGLLNLIFKFTIHQNNEFSAVIINYHRFVENSEGIIEIHPSVSHLIDDFEQEIKFLKSHFNIVSLDEIVNTLQSKKKFTKPTVAITIDDGFKDNFELLFPVLKEENIPATIFLSTSVIGTTRMNWYDQLASMILHASHKELKVDGLFDGKIFSLSSNENKRFAYVQIVEALKNVDIQKRDQYLKNIENCLGLPKEDKPLMLNWDEIRTMNKAQVSFGGHTHTHPILTRMPLEEAKKDILDSKLNIERELGVKVKHFAYPNGRATDFNEDLREYCREIGFSSISTLNYGNNKRPSDVWELRRISSESPVSLFAANVARALLRK